MKKILCILTALSVAASFAVSALAADKANNEPDVVVDGSRIIFSDQEPVIVDDLTLVPARGVFEAMGNYVRWDDKTRTVFVTSSTGVREVRITIDSDTMEVYTHKSLFERVQEDVTLEVPAKIMNDRTMIPLRAVSEAFDCDVEWDNDAYTVRIKTGVPILLEGYTYQKPSEDEMVKMSLSADASEVEAGGEFTVYVDVANIPENSYVSAVVALFKYDKSKFEYVEGSGNLLDNFGEPLADRDCVENTELEEGTKVVFINIEENGSKDTDGHIYKATFRKLTDESGTIEFDNSYDLLTAYQSYVMFTEKGTVEDVIYMGRELLLDTNPITVE